MLINNNTKNIKKIDKYFIIKFSLYFLIILIIFFVTNENNVIIHKNIIFKIAPIFILILSFFFIKKYKNIILEEIIKSSFISTLICFIILQILHKYNFLTINVEIPNIINYILSISLLILGVINFYFFSHKTKKFYLIPNKYFNTACFIITSLYALLYIYLLFNFTGSYGDEYSHFFTGIEFLKNGELPKIHNDLYYTRGLNISIIVGLLFYFLGKTIFIAKILPIAIGMMSYCLLFKIAKKIFTKKYLIIVTLLMYTISNLVIVNHFYVRMYVYYEFILLLLIYLTFRYIDTESKLKKNTYIIFSLLITFSTIILSDDLGSYLLVAPNILLGFIIYNKNKKNIKRIIFIIAISFILFIFIYFHKIIFGILYFYFNGNTLSMPNTNFSYLKIFLNQYILESSMFIVSVLSIRKIDSIYKKIVICITSLLLLIFIFANSEIQTIRSISFIIPIFLISSLIFLDKVNFSKIFNSVIILSMIVLTLINYPINFFEGPYIENEVVYYDFKKIYDKVDTLCKDNNLYNLIYAPYISNFYTEQKNTGYISQNFISSTDLYYSNENNEYFTSYKNIPILYNNDLLNNLITNKNNICVVTFSDPKQYWRFISETQYNLLRKNYNFIDYKGVTLFYK